MEFPACIRLPFLRPRKTGPQFALYLCPGHIDADAASWLPPDLPLARADAARFSLELARLSLPELECMWLSARRDQAAQKIASQAEMRALAEFAGAAAAVDPVASAREMAQKLLLWRWFWEECQEEIAQLATACELAERSLPAHFGDGQAESPDAMASRLQPEADAMWRPVTANAAFFLPPGTAILAEGEMAVDLMERLDFKPQAHEPGRLRRAQAPLWQALGHSRPASGSAAAIYNPERVWFVWSEA